MKTQTRHCERSEAIQKATGIKRWIASSAFSLLAMTIVIFSLNACGFRPVYGINSETPTSVESRLADVDIGNIPDASGQYLRNALIDRFYRDGRPTNPKYTLSIKPITEVKTDLDITKTANTTRAQMRLSSSMVLIDKATGQTVLSRTLSAVTSYNILGSEFATRVTEQSARQDGLDDLARQVEIQVSLYLKRLDNGTETPPAPLAPPMKFEQFNSNAPGVQPAPPAAKPIIYKE